MWLGHLTRYVGGLNTVHVKASSLDLGKASLATWKFLIFSNFVVSLSFERKRYCTILTVDYFSVGFLCFRMMRKEPYQFSREIST